MPSLKISQLTNGEPIQVTDEIPVNRSGLNYKVTIARYVTVWSVINASQILQVGNGYFTTGAGQLLLTLPVTSRVGDEIKIQNKNANGFRIVQNASQTIFFGNQNTTSGIGGYAESTEIGNTINLVCSIANTEWNAVYSMGNINYI